MISMICAAGAVGEADHQKGIGHWLFCCCDAFAFKITLPPHPGGIANGSYRRLPPSTPYPDLTTDLDRAERILLVTIRTWVESYREGEDPIPRRWQGLDIAGAPFSIDRLMALVSREIVRPIDIRCPRCKQLSPDEKHLLRAASLAQAGDGDLAEKVLRTTLLSAQGAEFAVGSLEGLGELFSQARLLLSRRRLQIDDQGSGDSREAWSPPRSIH